MDHPVTEQRRPHQWQHRHKHPQLRRTTNPRRLQILLRHLSKNLREINHAKTGHHAGQHHAKQRVTQAKLVHPREQRHGKKLPWHENQRHGQHEQQTLAGKRKPREGVPSRRRQSHRTKRLSKRHHQRVAEHIPKRHPLALEQLAHVLPLVIRRKKRLGQRLEKLVVCLKHPQHHPQKRHQHRQQKRAEQQQRQSATLSFPLRTHAVRLRKNRHPKSASTISGNRLMLIADALP